MYWTFYYVSGMVKVVYMHDSLGILIVLPWSRYSLALFLVEETWNNFLNVTHLVKDEWNIV